MALQVTGQAQGVVLAASQKSGSPAALSTGWHNDLIVSELLPRYCGLAQSGAVFSVSYAASVSIAPSTTTLGAFGLFNPVSSGKNLVILNVTAVGTAYTILTTSQPAAVLCPFLNFSPTSATVGNTPINALIGSGNKAVAVAYTQGTLVGASAQAVRIISVGQGWTSDDVAGALIIAPGSGFGLYGSGGTLADDTLTPVYTWAELPV